MTLEEMLEAKGVKTIEEYNEKISAEVKSALKAEQEKEEEVLRKQIKDLEAIKDSQGNTIGTTKKELDEAKSKLLELEKKGMEANKGILEKKPEDALAVKTEQQWRQENDAREKALTDEEWNKLEEATKALDAGTRKLAVATEEGRAAFMAEVLGSTEQAQETFRRPVTEKKLSVAEQIALALNKQKPNIPAMRRPQGSGFSNDRKEIKPDVSINPALLRTGSLRDMVAAHKKG